MEIDNQARSGWHFIPLSSVVQINFISIFFYFIARNFYFFMLIISKYFLFYIPFFLAILIIAT